MIDLQLSESIAPEGAQPPVDLAALETAAQAALRQGNAPGDAELTLLLTGDEEIHELNRQFLGIDAPTDVLSFPAGEEVDPDSGAPYLGDVIISLPRAKAQAAAGGHALEAELQLLSVHGVLHLLGYDHATLEEKGEMWRRQAEALASIGCPITSPPVESSE